MPTKSQSRTFDQQVELIDGVFKDIELRWPLYIGDERNGNNLRHFMAGLFFGSNLNGVSVREALRTFDDWGRDVYGIRLAESLLDYLNRTRGPETAFTEFFAAWRKWMESMKSIDRA